MKTYLNKLSSPEEIFADIRETDVEIKDPYKGITVPIKDYVMLHSSTGYFKSGTDITFLGLNSVFKVVKETEKEINGVNRKSFWLRNSELFACMCALVYQWIDQGEKEKFPDPNKDFLPKDWIEMLKPKVITIEPNRNWYGFVVDLNRIKTHLQKDIVHLIDSIYKKGFSLTLLTENGLGNNNSANIYIQISETSPFSKPHDNDDNQFNYYSLTLEKTNFKVEYGKNPEKLFHYFSNKEMIVSKIGDELKKHSASFMGAINNFNALFELMSRENLDRTSYNALLLDLYDRNRNESSVDLDSRLKNLLKKTIRKGHNFTNKPIDSEYTWAHLIKCVVHNNAEDIFSKVLNNPNEITHLFSKKMVIQKMERVYTAVLLRPDKDAEMKKYILKQVASYQEIEPYI